MANVNRFVETNTARWHPVFGECELLFDLENKDSLVVTHLPSGANPDNDVVLFDRSGCNYFIFDDINVFDSTKVQTPHITVKYGSSSDVELYPVAWYFNKPVFTDTLSSFFYYDPEREKWIFRNDGLIGQVANFDGWGVAAYEVSDVPCFFPSAENTITLSPIDDTPEATVSIKLSSANFGFYAASERYGEYVGYGTNTGKTIRLGVGQWSGSDGKTYRELVYGTTNTARPPQIRGLTYNNEEDVYILGVYGSSDGWHQVNAEDVKIGQAITLSFVSPSGDSGENIELTWLGYMPPEVGDGAWIYVCDTLCWR